MPSPLYNITKWLYSPPTSHKGEIMPKPIEIPLSTKSNKNNTFPRRPWLEGNTAIAMGSPLVLHVDLWAFKYRADNSRIWILIEYRPGGKYIIASDWYLCSEDTIEPYTGMLPIGPIAAYWHLGTHDLFRRAHGALMRIAHSHGQIDFNVTSILCHYMALQDTNPAPRGMVNMYNYPKSAAGEPARPCILPDWL
jgi:hypothetical protein